MIAYEISFEELIPIIENLDNVEKKFAKDDPELSKALNVALYTENEGLRKRQEELNLDVRSLKTLYLQEKEQKKKLQAEIEKIKQGQQKQLVTDNNEEQLKQGNLRLKKQKEKVILKLKGIQELLPLVELIPAKQFITMARAILEGDGI